MSKLNYSHCCFETVPVTGNVFAVAKRMLDAYGDKGRLRFRKGNRVGETEVCYEFGERVEHTVFYLSLPMGVSCRWESCSGSS